MVCAPEMLGNCYRSTNALMPLAADAARLLTARFLACIAGKGRGSIFCGSAIDVAPRAGCDLRRSPLPRDARSAEGVREWGP